MDDVKAKQQIVDKIKESTNILVTVSNDPSVDALSAALGLTLLVDALDKHATAVFSGMIPSAIAFLEPEKTFEHTTDSLRDFIIALDKEKADHLRYKVEGDSVKIFITPYRTTISSDDLEFSQGDYNVELVIALGVDQQDHLDGALDSHGRILHDAPVIAISAGDQPSQLGTIDWHDAKASSLSEMIASLADLLKNDTSLLDKQISTALLTGIVAETDRFSNPHTTSKVMTVAAQLMAAGADQQLIASKLQEPQDDEVVVKPAKKTASTEIAQPNHGLDIHHRPNETLEEMDKRVRAKNQEEAAEVATTVLHESEEKAPSVGTVHSSVDAPLSDAEPSFGGTLNATTDQAAEDKRHEVENDQNKTILSHAYLGSNDDQPAMSGATIQDSSSVAPVDPLSAVAPAAPEEVHSAYALDPQQVPAASEEVKAPEPEVVVPAVPAPTDLGLPMPPPIPDFSATPPPVTAMTAAYAPDPVVPVVPVSEPTSIDHSHRLGDILAPEPQATAAPTPPATNDPGQFKIPGQS